MTGATRSKQQVELDLSSRYHQPAGVEQFGLEPIPVELKTVRWYDLFVIVVNFLINPATILIGGLSVSAGLSFWAALLAQTLGCFVSFLAYVTIATIGVDYGIPGQVATRMTFGLRGAKWGPSFLRVIASTYWFAFQTIAGSIVIVQVLDSFFGGKHSLILISLVFGFGQVVVAVWGYGSLKILSRFAFPLKIAILTFLWIELSHTNAASYHLPNVLHYAGKGNSGWMLFAIWVNSVATGWIVMITDAADFCRYSRSRKDMWFGTILAALSGCVFCTFLGAYAAAATEGANPNFFVVVTNVHGDRLTLIAVIVVVMLDDWTINVLNLYTGGLSLSNIFEKVGRFWTTLAVGVLSVALSALPSIVSSYLQFTTALGNLFAPVAGVLLGDYLFIRKGKIDLPALFAPNGAYWYYRGFNPIAIFWTLAGFGLYYEIPANLLQTFSTILIVGAGYVLTVRFYAMPRAARYTSSLTRSD